MNIKRFLILLLGFLWTCSLWEYKDPSASIGNELPETYLALTATDTIFAAIDSIYSSTDTATGITTYDTTWTYYIGEDPDSGKYIDTLTSAFTDIFTSRQELHWWGEDPDGIIMGYYYKWNFDINWTYTNNEGGVFYIPIRTDLDVFNFSIKAIDNNAKWDYKKPAKSETDNEYFSDIGDSTGFYDNSDLILSEGKTAGIQTPINSSLILLSGDEVSVLAPTDTTKSVDLTPAKLVLPITNSKPSIEFRFGSNPFADDLPTDTSFTFPTRTFVWDVNDQDGIETITDVYYALDDTCETCWHQLDAASYSSFTLTEIPPGLHIFYLKARDIAGAESRVAKFPDPSNESEVKYWKVMTAKGNVLLVDDFYQDSQNNAQNWYKGILDMSLGTENYSVWEIGGALPYSTIDVTANLLYFDHIIWFSGSTGKVTFDEAESSIYSSIMNGRNIFLNISDTTYSTYTWFPIDSMFLLNPHGRMAKNTIVKSQIKPELDMISTSNIAIPVQGFETFTGNEPDCPQFTSLYRLNEPTIDTLLFSDCSVKGRFSFSNDSGDQTIQQDGYWLLDDDGEQIISPEMRLITSSNELLTFDIKSTGMGTNPTSTITIWVTGGTEITKYTDPLDSTYITYSVDLSNVGNGGGQKVKVKWKRTDNSGTGGIIIDNILVSGKEDEWTGAPNVCGFYKFSKNDGECSGKVVLMTLPLHDGSNPIFDGSVEFIRYLLEEEFIDEN